jgi:hypothetical protein
MKVSPPTSPPLGVLVIRQRTDDVADLLTRPHALIESGVRRTIESEKARFRPSLRMRSNASTATGRA